MQFIEKYKTYLTVLFVMVIAVSLTTILYVEVLWWSKNNSNQETVANVGFQTDSGKMVAMANIVETKVIVPMVNDSVVGEDARPVIIERFLKKYNSPLVPYSKMIFELSETYGFEYYWIVAIAMQESGLCKNIPEGSNNCWGYGIHKRGTLTFESYDLALKSYANYLKTQYFDKGLNTPELIMKKYCPSSNGSWANGVQHFINEMEMTSVDTQ